MNEMEIGIELPNENRYRISACVYLLACLLTYLLTF